MGYPCAARSICRKKIVMAIHRKMFTRYALVGLANTIIYFSLLWFFLDWNIFSYAVSVGLAFGIAMSFHYLANKYFTFESHSRSFGELVRYFSMAAVNYCVSLITVWFCLDIISVSTFFASVISSFIVIVLGYFIAFFWVFRGKEELTLQ
jgi:putative flippase GtrA